MASRANSPAGKSSQKTKSSKMPVSLKKTAVSASKEAAKPASASSSKVASAPVSGESKRPASSRRVDASVSKAAKPASRAKVPAASVPPRDLPRRKTAKAVRPQSSERASLLEGELPVSYGMDRLVAIPKDPEWTHLYWEISDATRQKLSAGSSDGFRLRGFDTTGLLFDGKNAPVALDLEVAPYARSWYVRLPYQGRVYTFEYGLVTSEGGWQAVARSRPVGFEPGMMGFRPDSEEWVSIASEELFRAAAGLGDGEGINDLIKRLRSRTDGSGAMAGAAWLTSWGSGMGRMELAPSSWGPSSFETQSAFSPSSWSTTSIGSGVSWSGVPGGRPQGPGGRSKDFWLWVETELTLYGATEPDAQVTLMGRPITLNPDGTFRVQFPFPHGTELHMDVRAVDRDGDQVREAKPAARRWTEE